MSLYQKNLKTNNFFEYFLNQNYKTRDDYARYGPVDTPKLRAKERVVLCLSK